MAEPGLHLEGLTVRRGDRAVVADAALDVPAGHVVALLGANGAGKSSLVLAASGALPAAAGRVWLAGVDVTRMPAHRRARAGLALVPEGRRVFAGMSVRDNLAVACAAPAARAERLAAVLALFPDLAGRLAAPAWQLSGGQQQMLVIGRALMGAPTVLLLDEPSLGLGPRLVADVMAKVRAIADAGAAVLLAEQNAHAALAVADHAVVLRAGRIAAHGPPERFADQAALLAEYLAG